MATPDTMSPLEQRLSSLLAKRKTHSKLRSLKSSPPGSIDFSSNDFLSLATTEQFRKDYLEELQHQTLPVGSTGSRLLDGNSKYSEKLERRIADFHGAQTGLLTNSGFDANVSIFTCLPQPGDVIVYDELIHASVHDGMRQSRATSFLSFKHNCLGDLRKKLNACRSSGKNVFVAVESVYSMDGDLAPLDGMVQLINELFPNRNCHLIVDEAHATGVYGPEGRGRVSELGLEKHIFVRLHTFGKALASNGAIILCSEVVRSYLINYARPLIYTTFMSFPALTAIKVAYDWLEAGKTEKSAANLFDLIFYLHSSLQKQEIQDLIEHLPQDCTVQSPTDCPESPIFALLTNHPRELAAHCQAAGFVVRAVVAPTVPEGTERVRICLHAGNTREEIDAFVSRLRMWLWEKTRSGSAAGSRKEASGAYRDGDGSGTVTSTADTSSLQAKL